MGARRRGSAAREESGMRSEQRMWNSQQRSRYGRRAVMRAGLAGSAAAFLAACGGAENDKRGSGAVQPAAGTAAAQQEAPPKPGGQLREATITQAPHFSPFHPGADPSFINTWRRVYGYYEPLWGFKDINQIDRL